MPSALNLDVLHVTCTRLAGQQDFASLFNCARAGRALTSSALLNLYRIQNKAPVIRAAAADDGPLALDLGKATRKWAILWRSIILSCFDGNKTLEKYAEYVRKLDFEELVMLLDSQSFRGRTSSYFFSGELQQFKVERIVKGAKGKTTSVSLDVAATVNAIAEFVLQKTRMLEKIHGSFNQQILQHFLPNATRLIRLRVFKGSVLKDTGHLIQLYCPNFSKLQIFNWPDETGDEDCAAFLSQLRPHTLQAFGMFGGSRISVNTFLALNGHSKTLTKLDLHSIAASSMEYLSAMQDCTNLISLKMAENIRGTQNLAEKHPDVFQQLIEWLSQCKKLRFLEITNFVNGPEFLASVLREPQIKLEKFGLEGYQLVDAKDFHQALGLQTSLRSLFLNGVDSEYLMDNQTLVECLSGLVNLRDLRLTGIAASFSEQHIATLAQRLPKLEEFWTGGWHITDGIWDHLKDLKFLRKLELNADTRFTDKGIQDFVTSLDGESNAGFSLYIMMQDTDCNISDDEQDNIRRTMVTRLGGRFEFQLVRAPEEDDYSDSGSD